MWQKGILPLIMIIFVSWAIVTFISQHADINKDNSNSWIQANILSPQTSSKQEIIINDGLQDNTTEDINDPTLKQEMSNSNLNAMEEFINQYLSNSSNLLKTEYLTPIKYKWEIIAYQWPFSHDYISQYGDIDIWKDVLSDQYFIISIDKTQRFYNIWAINMNNQNWNISYSSVIRWNFKDQQININSENISIKSLIYPWIYDGKWWYAISKTNLQTQEDLNWFILDWDNSNLPYKWN